MDIGSLVYVTKKIRGQWVGHVEGLGPEVQTAYWDERENALIHLRGLVEEQYNQQHTLRYKLIRARSTRTARRSIQA